MIELLADQAAFDAWIEALKRRVADEPDHLPVDIMDASVVFATCRALAELYPDMIPALIEHTPAACEAAFNELGMVMGVDNLARLVGLDPLLAKNVLVDLLASGQ